jgi:hypothetical protein
MLRFPVFSAVLAAATVLTSAQTVYVSRMWHNHQPTYWPEWNTNGGQNQPTEYAWDSIVLKSGRSYAGSSAQHPENNLTDIFGVDDRKNAYQSGPRNSLANLASIRRFLPQLLGLAHRWRALARQRQPARLRPWLVERQPRGPQLAHARRRAPLDLVGFTYHHSLAPLLPKAVLRKEIQTLQAGLLEGMGRKLRSLRPLEGLLPHRDGLLHHMIDVLADEGYEWSIVASHHISRTCPTYMNQGNPAVPTTSSPARRTRPTSSGPSPPSGWWYGQPNPGQRRVERLALRLSAPPREICQPGNRRRKVHHRRAVRRRAFLSFRLRHEGIEQDPGAHRRPSPPIPPARDRDALHRRRQRLGRRIESSWFEATPQFFNAAGRRLRPDAPCRTS